MRRANPLLPYDDTEELYLAHFTRLSAYFLGTPALLGLGKCSNTP